MKSKILILMFSVFAIFAGIPSVQAQLFQFENPMMNQAAPDFTLKTTEGATVNFSKYRDGKRAIIFFWATWCPHCRTQIKEIQSNQEQFLSQNTVMILIDTGEQKQQIVSYLKAAGVTLNVYLDQDGQVSDQYKIFGLPTFVFVNQQGIVTAVEHHLPKNFTEYFTSK